MILITGATGFIGKALVPELVHRNYPIAVLVNKTDIENSWIDKVKVLTADITDKNNLFNLEDYPFTKIIHLAAYIPFENTFNDFETCLSVNTVGTGNLLEFARLRGIKKVC